ncbi:MAG: serine hydrolase domain-containing protein [Dehalococcoidia bacterium]
MTTTARSLISTEIDHLVREQMQHWAVPGLALGLLRDGESEVRGYGVASLETEQPVTPGTIFQVGSISKTFTAVLVMQLVDEGKLDLDAPVKRYAPSLQLADAEARETVTLRHLLSHTGGFCGDDFRDFGMGDEALERAVTTFDTLKQYTRPGELWAYSNAGFDLAGYIVQQTLGKPFEALMRERVFEPLGMECSVYFAWEAITYPVAIGYNRGPGGERVIARPYPIPRRSNPAGGIIASAGDLLRWAALHLGDGTTGGKRVLSDASPRLMRTPQTAAGNFVEQWGLGLALRPTAGSAVVGHGGGANGFRSVWTLVPEQRFALAILTNGDGGAAAAGRIERQILARLAEVALEEPADAPIEPSQLARFAGNYERPGSSISVTAEADGPRLGLSSKSPLTGEQVSLPPMRLRLVGENAFRIAEGEFEGGAVDFIPGVGERPRFIRFGGRLAEPHA